MEIDGRRPKKRGESKNVHSQREPLLPKRKVVDASVHGDHVWSSTQLLEVAVELVSDAVGVPRVARAVRHGKLVCQCSLDPRKVTKAD